MPLPRVVADGLSAHIAHYPPNVDGTIFTGITGITGITYARETYSRAVARAVKSADLPQGTTSHALRHHYASVSSTRGESSSPSPN